MLLLRTSSQWHRQSVRRTPSMGTQCIENVYVQSGEAMRLTYAQWKHRFAILILFSKKKKNNFLIARVI